MATIDDKLDTIIQILAGKTATVPKAYERPALLADDPRLIIDGQTVNSDGSIWAPIGGAFITGQAQNSSPLRIVYGYISPTKTPEVWTAAADLLGPDVFKTWDAAWKKNPYGTYGGDPAVCKAGRAGGLNFMFFNFLFGQPSQTHFQD
jgi:hypothetical protein